MKSVPKTKFSVSTPSDPDIDPARLKCFKFDSDKLNVNENIKRELQQSNLLKDSNVVDQIVEKHLKMRGSHLAAYVEELRKDTRKKFWILKKAGFQVSYPLITLIDHSQKERSRII